jgi:tellurite resistance-related uncharacterized protein
MTRKLLRDVRTLDEDTNLFNPGMVHHIESSDDDARSEMQMQMQTQTQTQTMMTMITMNIFEEG